MTGPATGRPDAEPAAPAEPQTSPAASASLVIGLLVGSAFVMILNETIMSVALPSLIADLGITVSTAQWLTSGFLLTMAVVIPITGFLLQRFPPRRVYLASMLLFSAGTLVSALAPGFPVLLAGRIVQATGTAVMVPLLMTTVMRLVPAERRGRHDGHDHHRDRGRARGRAHPVRGDPQRARLAVDVLDRAADRPGRVRGRRPVVACRGRGPPGAPRPRLGGALRARVRRPRVRAEQRRGRRPRARPGPAVAPHRGRPGGTRGVRGPPAAPARAPATPCWICGRSRTGRSPSRWCSSC